MTVNIGIYVVSVIVAALIGFAVGRIKNAKKLAEIEGLLTGAESHMVKEVREMASYIKSKL
jgi:hypothetical protein